MSCSKQWIQFFVLYLFPLTATANCSLFYDINLISIDLEWEKENSLSMNGA